MQCSTGLFVSANSNAQDFNILCSVKALGTQNRTKTEKWKDHFHCKQNTKSIIYVLKNMSYLPLDVYMLIKVFFLQLCITLLVKFESSVK